MSDAINLNDYVAGGYFVARYAPFRPVLSQSLPERFISLSGCFAKTACQYWGWEAEKNTKEILDFGIAVEKLPALKKWSSSKDIGYPNVFYTLAAAQQFIAEFLPHDQDLLVLGIAIPSTLLNGFLIIHKSLKM